MRWDLPSPWIFTSIAVLSRHNIDGKTLATAWFDIFFFFVCPSFVWISRSSLYGWMDRCLVLDGDVDVDVDDVEDGDGADDDILLLWLLQHRIISCRLFKDSCQPYQYRWSLVYLVIKLMLNMMMIMLFRFSLFFSFFIAAPLLLVFNVLFNVLNVRNVYRTNWNCCDNNKNSKFFFFFFFLLLALQNNDNYITQVVSIPPHYIIFHHIRFNSKTTV